MTSSMVYFAVLVDADVDGVGVAEEVVQVAEDLLVGPEQERAEVIRFVRRRGAAPGCCARRGGR